jgi:hypothetical protein
MTAADFVPIFQALIAAAALVLTTLTGIYVPKLIAAFERRTDVVVTDQERASVMQSITTATGLIQTRIDQGLLKVSEVSPVNPVVLKEASAALARVPDSATAQKTSVDAAAAMIVARVDTSPKVQPVAALPVPGAFAGPRGVS